MSIYAVPLYNWFKDDKDLANICKTILRYNHCAMCGGKCNFRTAVADHSMPWGYYHDVWCTQRCEKEYWNLVRSVTNKQKPNRLCSEEIISEVRHE